MNTERLIKRYPNRKLYDVQTSSYVNLEDIYNVAFGENEKVKILDSKTKEDLTESILHSAVTKNRPDLVKAISNFVNDYSGTDNNSKKLEDLVSLIKAASK